MLIQLMVNTFVSFSNDAVARYSFVVRAFDPWFDGLLDRSFMVDPLSLNKGCGMCYPVC